MAEAAGAMQAEAIETAGSRQAVLTRPNHTLSEKKGLLDTSAPFSFHFS